MFLTAGVVTLGIGTAVYLLFRPQSIVAMHFPLPSVLTRLRPFFSFLDHPWIKYYFSDYLWAVSLCCGLHCILLPSNKGSLLCFAITVCYGFIWELLQYASIFKGTGDLWDILMYILAGFTVLILNFISKKGEKT